MGGDLNGFRDIKPFYEVMGWGIAGHATGVIQVSVIEWNYILYGLGVGI